MEPDCFVDALAKAIPYLEILRSKPTANAPNLKVSVQAVCKVLISAGIANEARIE